MDVPQNIVHLWVEKGPDAGRRIAIPPQGARVGRSSKNDVELTDESLSRFQCRFYFNAEGRLCLADLGSTNGTLVNNEAVSDRALTIGDVIEIGSTLLRVMQDHLHGAEGEVPPPVPGVGAPIDLGLSGAPPPPEAAPRVGVKRWIWPVVAAAVAVVAVAVVIRLLTSGTSGPEVKTATKAPEKLEIRYEKVEASPANIFRYEVTLAGGTLSLRLDSLSENRHVTRDKQVGGTPLDELAADLENSGFFGLDEVYQGLAPGAWDSWNLNLTLGRRTHTVVVRNRTEPEVFKRAREKIEDYVKTELGLGAVSLPPEKLREEAENALRQGQKLVAEREVSHVNLFNAIRSFELAVWYLESIEPKPAFYADAVAGLDESKRLLEDKYKDLLFQADRAERVRDWETAAKNLRALLDAIPARDDERHQKAAKQLIAVEGRMKRK